MTPAPVAETAVGAAAESEGAGAARPVQPPPPPLVDVDDLRPLLRALQLSNLAEQHGAEVQVSGPRLMGSS
jgi:hypothetical protein